LKKTLKEIADLVNGQLLGDGDIEISGVSGIAEASAVDITFAVEPHLEAASQSGAAAILIPSTVTEFAKPAIRVENPRVAFVTLLQLFAPKQVIEPGIHPTAVVGAGVIMGDGVSIMAYAVIEEGVQIGSNTVIYPHTYIGSQVVIGRDALIYPNVTIREGCHIGDRVIVHSGAVIGSDGFGFVTVDGRHQKVPQVGNVLIEEDVEIGANVAIDRAAVASTIVKKGTKIDNLVHIAHNVVIGEHCYLVALTGIAGSTKVGNYVTFAGQSGSAGHLTIGDRCVFAAKAGVIGDVPAGSFYAGFPARPHKEWLRAEASGRKVPDLIKKIRDLERRLDAMEK